MAPKVELMRKLRFCRVKVVLVTTSTVVPYLYVNAATVAVKFSIDSVVAVCVLSAVGEYVVEVEDRVIVNTDTLG
jgi:hypothetical protein